MKRLILFFLIISSGNILLSQNATDALRYSQIYYGGSARFQGLGGAFGAVGADFSVVATNPAGIGVYKSSEMTFSPTFAFHHSVTDFNNGSGTENRGNVGMADFGCVFTIPINGGQGPIKRINIAFGMNRQSDFNNRFYIQGNNNKSSMLMDFTDVLNNTPGADPSQYPFDAGLAYNTNLIYYDSASNAFHSDFGDANPATRLIGQTKYVTTHGSINEFDLSFATNFEDKLYIGATIGIPFIRYFETSEYQEFRKDTSIHYFRSMTYDQYVETHGTGVNLKVGVIYKPADWVRIGAAIHTPTFYGNMRDNWNSSMTSVLNYTTNSNNSATDEVTYQESPLGTYDYQMTTPFRAIGSLAFIIGSYGLITGEYEYVNYDQARFYNSSSSYSDLNDQIKSTYTSPVIVRAGTEWRIMNFRIRGGFDYYGSPYSSGNLTGKKYQVSGGIGYRGQHFFCDLAYIWSQVKDDYYLYDPALVNPSQNTYTQNSVVATFGVRF
jgi:hypothetical protein